jgi:ABC-type antimicrobial peptide transport system permease subunit
MACLNLAGSTTARLAARRPEIALRSALGASRNSLLRLLLTESLVLSPSGSLLRMAFARFIVPVILTSSPIDLPQLHKAQIDLPVATFAIAIGCVTTLFFGLLPALNAFREGCGRVCVAFQGNLQCEHVLWLKAWRYRTHMNKGSKQERSSGQQR